MEDYTNEDFVSMREFEEMTGITRMSIMRWAREYDFKLAEKHCKRSTKYFIDKNLVTVFKEIKIIKREIQREKITTASRGRVWKVSNKNAKKYSAFKIGELYEVFKNDKVSPVKLGFYKYEDIIGNKNIQIF